MRTLDTSPIVTYSKPRKSDALGLLPLPATTPVSIGATAGGYIMNMQVPALADFNTSF